MSYPDKFPQKWTLHCNRDFTTGSQHMWHSICKELWESYFKVVKQNVQWWILFYIVYPVKPTFCVCICFVPLLSIVALKNAAKICVCRNLAYLTPPTDGGEWTNTEIEPCAFCPNGTTNSYASAILSFGRDEAGRQCKTIKISTKLMPYSYLSKENKNAK